ncbi:hypothetical protein ES702_04779 [subsurface metagenome]
MTAQVEEQNWFLSLVVLMGKENKVWIYYRTYLELEKRSGQPPFWRNPN